MKQLDKYYTNYNIIKICCKIFKKYIKIFKNDLVIEPSAGNGAFYNCIKNYNNIMFDIKPENKLIIKKDFLKLNHKKIKKNFMLLVIHLLVKNLHLLLNLLKNVVNFVILFHLYYLKVLINIFYKNLYH